MAVEPELVPELRERPVNLSLAHDHELTVAFSLADERECVAVRRPRRLLVRPACRRCIDKVVRSVERNLPQLPPGGEEVRLHAGGLREHRDAGAVGFARRTRERSLRVVPERLWLPARRLRDEQAFGVDRDPVWPGRIDETAAAPGEVVAVDERDAEVMDRPAPGGDDE